MWGPSAAAPRPCGPADWTGPPPPPSSGACRSSGSASGSNCSTRGPRRTRPTRAWASCPVWSGGCPPASSTPRCSGTGWSRCPGPAAACWPACPTRPGCTSSTPTRPMSPPTPPPPVTTAGPVVGLGRAGPGVGHPVPPREVGERRVGHPGQLRGCGPPRRAVMDLYPAIDIRDGGAVRLTQGDFDRQTRVRRPRGPGPPLRRRRGPVAARGRPGRGPAGAAGQPRRPCWPSPRPWTSRSQTGGGVRIGGRRGRTARRGGGPGRPRHGGPRGPGSAAPSRRAAIPAGWRWASTTGATPTVGPRWPCGVGSTGRADASRTCWPSWPGPGWPR